MCSYAKALIKLEVTSPRALWEQIKTYGTSYLTEEVKMSNMCAFMVMEACQKEFGSAIHISPDNCDDTSAVFSPTIAAQLVAPSTAATKVIIRNLEQLVIWLSNDIGIEWPVAFRQIMIQY